MKREDKGFNNEVFNIEEFLWEPKSISQNDITTKNFSDKSILSSEFKNNNHGRENDKHERVIDILVNQIYPLEYKSNVDNLGRQAINDWIFENIILKDLNKQIVIDYFISIKYLDPWVFWLVTETIKDYVYTVTHNLGYKKASELTLDQLTDVDTSNDILDKVNNSVKRQYLVSFLNFLNPGKKFKAELKIEDYTKIKFQHPLVKYCEMELRKKGDKDASIKNNLTSHIKKHFEWICSLKEFENYDINNVLVNQIRSEHLKSYKCFLIRQVKEGEITELSAKRHFQYVKRFYTLLYSKNKIIKNISINIRNLTAEDYIYRELPSTKELQRFYDVVEMYSQNPIKERLAFLLMTHLGFRINEVAELKWEDINIDTKTISFLGKGDHRTILPISKVILHSLLKMELKETGFVFSNDTKNYKLQIYQNYKLYTMILGWRYKGGPHLLRHKYITSLTKHCSIRVLKILSRHKSSASLSRYIHIDSGRLTEAIDMIKI